MRDSANMGMTRIFMRVLSPTLSFYYVGAALSGAYAMLYALAKRVLEGDVFLVIVL